MKKRIEFYDIAKGLLIITVVAGHSGIPYEYLLYWFHMPVFFIISGLLYKKRATHKATVNNISQKTISYTIPFIMFFTIITVSIYIKDSTQLSLDQLIVDLKRLIFGGRPLRGYYSVFWFINVFLLTNIAFSVLVLIESNLRNSVLKRCFLPISMLILYSLAHYYTNHDGDLSIVKSKIWNYPTILITLPYFYLGYTSKDIISKLAKSTEKQKKALLISSFLAILFLATEKASFMRFRLNLKNNIYDHYFLDLLIPANFTLLFLVTSMQLQKKRFSKVISALGINSLIIMYMHPAMPLWIGDFLFLYFPIYILIGVSLPTLFAVLSKKFKITRLLFWGILPKSVQSKLPFNQG